MKTCPRCGIEKPKTEYYECKRLKDGLSCYCKACQRAANAASAAKNPAPSRAAGKRFHDRNREKRNAESKDYRAAHPEYFREKRKEWAATHRAYNAAKTAKSRASLKEAAYQAYGGHRCVCCGESERMFLTIDHIHNDGNSHRKSMGLRSGGEFYSWLRREGYPTGFQVLCRNCNWGKHINGGVCPHAASKVQRLERKLVGSSEPKREAA